MSLSRAAAVALLAQASTTMWPAAVQAQEHLGLEERQRLVAGYTSILPYLGSVVAISLACAVLLVLANRDPEAATVGDSWRARVARRQWPLWFLLATTVFVLANHFLIRGRAVGIWDATVLYYPYQALVADFARARRFVYWDPWSNGGIPMLGDPQVGVFSPIAIVVGLITGGTSWGFVAYWVLMWWLGAIGVFLLARHLGSPGWGACVVALGYLFCGLNTSNAEHTSWIISFSSLPFVVWRLDVSLATGRLWPAVEAGALWGLSGLSGYPPLTVITGGFLALWVAGRWAWLEPALTPPASSPLRTDGRLSAGFVVAGLALTALAGGTVLSPAFFAFFYEGAGTHSRVGPVLREFATGPALTPGTLATFATPYLNLLKYVAREQLWLNADISMSNLYVGAVPSMLAAYALIGPGARAWRWWLMGLTVVVGLGCSMAEPVPLRGWLHDWVYPMRFFRFAYIFRPYFFFPLTVLALLGARDLHARAGVRSADRRLVLAAVLVAALAGVGYGSLLGSEWHGRLPTMLRWLGLVHLVAVWSAVCAIAVGWSASEPRIRRLLPAALVAVAVLDALVTSVLTMPTTARTVEVERWKARDEAHRASLDLTSRGLARDERSCLDPPACEFLSNEQLFTKVPVFQARVNQRNPLHLRMAAHPMLRGMATGSQRVWFSSTAAEVRPTEAAFDRFLERAEALGRSPLVVHAPETLLGRARPSEDLGALAGLPAVEPVPTRVLHYGPDELLLEVQVPAEGWLLVTDRWARSWRASVNGGVVTVYGGNFIFRAVRVPAGTSRVEFQYHPLGFPWWVVASWGALGLVAFGSVWRHRSSVRGQGRDR